MNYCGIKNHPNPRFYEDEKIPMSTLLQDIIMFYKYGGKQLYYFNTYDGATDEVEEPAHPYVSQDEPLDDEECESLVSSHLHRI